MKGFELVLFVFTLLPISVTFSAFSQGSEIDYLDNFDAIQAASYAAVDDPNGGAPSALQSTCKEKGNISSFQEVIVTSSNSRIRASQVKKICRKKSICVIPAGLTLVMNDNLNVGALIVRGTVKWNDKKSKDGTFLCAGYIAIEQNGSWKMNLQSHAAWIYIKNNGAYHPNLKSRAFGSVAMNDSESPSVFMKGKTLQRTWSLLSMPLKQGDRKMYLMHDPTNMGWSVGDRIAVAPTERLANGSGEAFRIQSIDSSDGSITLDNAVEGNFLANLLPSASHDQEPMLMSAEVINLDRNIVITGDDFQHIDCDPNLPEAIPGEETSLDGCRCSSFRQKCTLGLHTIHMNAGSAHIQDVRLEKCGQRGIEGKYCLHFHKLDDCPNCLFKNNAIETSHQRGIIIHDTHRSKVESNVLYNVRGSGIYIEDGNEMYNSLSYNVVICPFAFNDPVLHGCTVPGTSNRLADTSDNHAGIFSRGATNDMIGNHVSNAFNGMFLNAGGTGRGESSGRVCESDSKMGRIEGNTFHGNGRFGTYTLGSNYPKSTDQSIATRGYNNDKSLCEGFDEEGNTRGISTPFRNNFDYHNAFVGHYNAGDIQYNGHQSNENNNLIYWKETKNFENGCSAHISGGNFLNGNMALPDVGTFIIENTFLGDGVHLEANHHCNVGVTGVLCMPQYVLHQVVWSNKRKNSKWVSFQSMNFQGHNSNQNHGGIFTLSPSEANTTPEAGSSFFPPNFVSLVSSKFKYLLDIPEQRCVSSSEYLTQQNEYAHRYDDGILCKDPLRALKVYSKGLVSASAPKMHVEISYPGGTITQSIDFHQIGGDSETRKQGYSFPVIPGNQFSYSISLSSGNGDIPSDWVIEFSDPVIGNRWEAEFLQLIVRGRSCPASISSQHDRRFMWSGDEFMKEEVWGSHGACSSYDNMPEVVCSDHNQGILKEPSCPELCQNNCNAENAFCDCGTETCKCREGFSGPGCSIDVCDDANCGDHGSCTLRYLSSSAVTVTANSACICDDGWIGQKCDMNPCIDQGETCSGNGKCIALNEQETFCECYEGYSGEKCQDSCDGVCQGGYPYGCSSGNLDGINRYGCHPSGGCHYLKPGEDYPYSGFCTYKTVGSPPQPNPTSSPVENPVQNPTPAPVPAPTPLPSNSLKCDGICQGEYPYGCNDNLSGVERYGCHPEGGCNYPKAGEDYPYPGFCTFKGNDPISNPTPTPVPAPTPPPSDSPSCDGICQGDYPYGCNENLSGVEKYGCHPEGGCNYPKAGEDYPYAGFCTFKYANERRNLRSK